MSGNKNTEILPVEIDGQIFHLDYSFENISRIWEMLSDRKVPILIVPNLAMCMLAHTTYFKDYSLDAAIDLLYTYWVNEAEGMILKGLSNVPGFTLFQFEQKLKKGGGG